MRRYQVLVIAGLAFGTAAVWPAGGARANGLGEDTSWQFQSASDVTAGILMEQLRQDKMGGLLNAQTPEYNYYSQTAGTISNLSVGNYESVSATNSKVSVMGSQTTANSAQVSGELNGALQLH